MAESSQNRQRATPFRENRRYFRLPSPTTSTKARLTVLALLLSLGWVAVAGMSRERRDRVCTHGPIHKSHAPWADQCDACHVPFTGQNGGLFETRERWNTYSCETCHAGSKNSPKEYAPHQPGKVNWNELNPEDCTLCHKDHQGAEFNLAKPADSACLQCHSNLKRYHRREDPLSQSMESFVGIRPDHPEFRLLRDPPTQLRSLRFSHSVHITTGLTGSIKLESIREESREQYQRFVEATSGQIKLDCTACHQLDSNSTPRQSGEVYLPIKYDQHCAACHDLKVGEQATLTNVKTSAFRVPHKIGADQLTGELNRQFLAQLTQKNPAALTLEPKPGLRLDPPVPKLAASVQTEVDRLTAKTLKELFEQPNREKSAPYSAALYCLKCHEAGDQPSSVKKTEIRSVWLPASRFDHSKHRSMDCKGCHESKYTTGSITLASQEHEPAGIPGIENCRTCHSPASVKDGKPLGGVRHGCVDCHSYHNGEHPLHGPGSPFRDPPADRRLTTEEMLRGIRKETAP